MGLFNIFRREAKPKEGDFLRNAEEFRLTPTDRAKYVVGEPKETEWYTVPRLKSDGIVGLYAGPAGCR